MKAKELLMEQLFVISGGIIIILTEPGSGD